MEIPISKVTPEAYEFLKKIQENPGEYTLHHEKRGARGLAIFGFIVVVGAFIASFPVAQESGEIIALWGWFLGWFFFAWIALSGWNYLKKYKKADLKPCLFINPIYLVRITLDKVIYYNLWLDRKDWKLTHHYYNGVYTNTLFNFVFEGNKNETISVSPKEKAEKLAETLQSYGQYIFDCVQKEDYAPIVAYDIFLEAKEQKRREIPMEEMEGPKGGFWNTFLKIGFIAAIVGGAFFLFNNYAIQGRRLRYCRSIAQYEHFLRTHYSPDFFSQKARENLFKVYKINFELARKNAGELRRLMNLKKCPELPPDREEEILVFYRTEGKKALTKAYLSAIESYEQKAASAPPAAREAIVKILRSAQEENLYQVHIAFAGATEQTSGTLFYDTEFGRKSVESMASSFTPELNRSRESSIQGKVKQSFATIIPQGILEFRNKGAIVFKISYTVVPSGMVYYSTKEMPALRKYYTGIRILWKFEMFLKEEKIHAFEEQTEPPLNFHVQEHRQRSPFMLPGGTVSASAIYNAMAQTAFNGFGEKIVRHFGIKN